MSSRMPSTQDSLTCIICQNDYSDPRILPCLHTFCARCIENIDPVQFNDERRSSASLPSYNTIASGTSSDTLTSGSLEHAAILCPICENEVTVPRTVQHLPINHMVRKHLSEQHVNKKRPLPFCDLCTGNHVALTFCPQCDHHLCDVCTEAHHRQRRTAYHKLSDVKPPITKLDKGLQCSRHQEDMRLFCDTCELLICRECLLSEHQAHICVFAEDMLELQTRSLQADLAKLKPAKLTLQNAMRSVQTACDRVDKKGETIEKEINTFIEKYIEALMTYRERLLDQLESVRDRRTKSLKMQKIELEHNLDDVCHGIRFTEELLSHGTPLEVLDCKRLVASRLKYLAKGTYKAEPCSDDYLEFLPKDRGEQVNGYKIFGSLVHRRADPQRCILTGDGLHCSREGHRSEMILITKDHEGEPMRKGGTDVKARLHSKESTHVTIPVQIRDRRDGNYEMTFTPDRAGQFFLSVAINGRQIKDSPFNVSIKGKWRSHTGVFQCCTFCATGGRKDVKCGCGSNMPGGYAGCGHGHAGHPGRVHWSCCGKLTKSSECTKPYHGVLQQVTL